MRKYAAATATGIALITMLALTVSASLTPANAGGGRCPPYRFDDEPPRPVICDLDAIRRGAPLMRLFDDKKHQECESKWVNWVEASRATRGVGCIPNTFDVSK
jgi:hypothetical protein